MELVKCLGCHKTEPMFWCWEGRNGEDADCPMHMPPRWKWEEEQMSKW